MKICIKGDKGDLLEQISCTLVLSGARVGWGWIGRQFQHEPEPHKKSVNPWFQRSGLIVR